MRALVLLVRALSFASCAHGLSEEYSFKTTLNTEEDGGLYELYWTFDNEAEIISFAVRVQTTGWVGFGISPNGQMPNSDVVIGWVTDDGETMFRDRFASRRGPPEIDEEQDWELVGEGEEEDGFTILEFRRKYVTCDDMDLPVTTETERVIWSFHSTTDPTSEDLTSDLIHSERGSRSLNLLGGLVDAPPDPDDLKYFDIRVDSVTIPDDDTTYWCAAFELPDNVQTMTRYITRFGPVVTEGNEAHVHHLLIYLCTGINETHVGNGGDCDEDVANEVAECRGGTIIGAWAVGGEDFVFPNNVGFPLGGSGSPQFAVMELHYDNPLEKKGTIDSSGMRFWYTSTPREHDAGLLEVGYFVHNFMVIPPNAKNFTITGIMNKECSNEFIPEDGIRVFANALHTHVVGHGLIVQHLRYSEECGGYEELEPIDKNLQYDFNFQQSTHLRREVVILPGDVIQLKCFYGTEGVGGVTIGGLSTRDEMCLTFLYYYPKQDIAVSLSRITNAEFSQYLGTLPSIDLTSPPETEEEYVEALNAVDWDEDRRNTLQSTLESNTQLFYCGDPQGVRGVFSTTSFPEIKCPYVAPEQCPVVEDAGVVLRASVAVLMVLSLLGAIVA